MSNPRRDSGFTLIEVLVTISLLGAMMAIAVSGGSSWVESRAHRGTAEELRVVLRLTLQRAVTESSAMCVRFTSAPSTYSVFRGRCAIAATRVHGPFGPSSSRVSLVPAFTDSTATGLTDVQFNARGTAWSGAIEVARAGAASYVVRVESFSGQVSVSR
jgi:type IV fimbrial biogenesis protein FimT